MSCSKEDCHKQAQYNYARLISPKFCIDHKLLYMIDVTDNECFYCDCNGRALYNYKNSRYAIYCSKHKLVDMVNIITDKCVGDYCYKGAIFNYVGEPIGFFCASHKLEDMIDVKNKVCEHEGCKTTASYNFKDEKPKFCTKHILPQMINVHDNLCIFEGCLTIACYSKPGGTKSLYCFKHKPEGMTNRKRAVCINDDCETVAVFNYENELKPIYCTKHKLPNMVDIRGTKCEFEGCLSKPCYGYEDKSPKFCSPHKLDDMVLLVGVCIYPKCHKSSIYNYEGLPPHYCSTHKTDTMINVDIIRCKIPLCDIQVGYSKKYEGYCACCFTYLFPDKPVSINYKSKEREVVKFVTEQFPLSLYTWVKDKIIAGGCSLRRPDLKLDLGYQVIMIEVDENAHGRYDTICDNKRTMELSQDVGHRPIIFIRFNPDSYKIDDVKIPSCWKPNKLGLQSVNNKTDWYKRLNTLKTTIDYWLDEKHQSHKTVHIEYLYYDQ